MFKFLSGALIITTAFNKKRVARPQNLSQLFQAKHGSLWSLTFDVLDAREESRDTYYIHAREGEREQIAAVLTSMGVKYVSREDEKERERQEEEKHERMERLREEEFEEIKDKES